MLFYLVWPCLLDKFSYFFVTFNMINYLASELQYILWLLSRGISIHNFACHDILHYMLVKTYILRYRVFLCTRFFGILEMGPTNVLSKNGHLSLVSKFCPRPLRTHLTTVVESKHFLTGIGRRRVPFIRTPRALTFVSARERCAHVLGCGQRIE